MSKKLDRKLVLFGAGEFGLSVLRQLGRERVYCFADNDSSKVNTVIGGKSVLSVRELLDIKHDISIFISAKYTFKSAIFQDLSRNGLADYVIGYWGKNKVKLMDNAYIGRRVSLKGGNLMARGAYLSDSKVGYASYIGENSQIIGASIGHFCSIGPNVRIVSGQHPAHTFVSTHPAFYSPNNSTGIKLVETQLFEEYRYADNGYAVKIGNDCWIGDGVLIIEGITIADGTIVAAGAVVTNDTTPYSIIGGVPAEIIKYRFSEEDIDFLIKLKWWDRGKHWIKENAAHFNDISLLKKMVSHFGIE